MNNNFKKIAVIGAGAVGSIIGGLLKKAGFNTTLIGRKPHIDMINKNGLIIKKAHDEIKININTSTKLNFKPDIIFITVKSNDIEEACKSINKYADYTPVVLMQNGVTADDIALKYFNKKFIYGAIIFFNGEYLEPGIVKYGYEGTVTIGKVFEENDNNTIYIKEMLDKIIKTTISSNIIGARWTKILVNCLTNSLDAITGLNLYDLMKSKVIRKLGVMILKEAYNIIKKAEIKLEDLPGLPVSNINFIIKSPFFISAYLLKIKFNAKKYCNTKTSTLQSIKRGKKTEIDYLNGEIVKLASKIGIEASINKKIVDLVHSVEKNHEFYTINELKKIFLNIL